MLNKMTEKFFKISKISRKLVWVQPNGPTEHCSTFFIEFQIDLMRRPITLCLANCLLDITWQFRFCYSVFAYHLFTIKIRVIPPSNSKLKNKKWNGNVFISTLNERLSSRKVFWKRNLDPKNQIWKEEWMETITIISVLI